MKKMTICVSYLLWAYKSVVIRILIIRACEEEAKARMGLVECVNHNLVEPYDVIYEKDGT